MREHVFGAPLTIGALVGISSGELRPVVPEALLARLADSSRRAERVAARRPVYGRSTGVGANRLTAATPDAVTHGMNLIRSHACDAGDPVPPETVRATLAVRLNQLLQGRSGIAVEVVRGLADMLQRDALPELREYGSVGTGDLPALSGVALALVGERPTSRPFPALPHLSSDSALPFISSSALTIAQAARSVDRLEALIRAQHAVFALSSFAASANPEAFAPAVARATGIPGSVEVAIALERLLDGTAWTPARIQDPYAFRGHLQTTSTLAVAVRRLADHLESLMNLGQENPLFPEEDERAYHHGSFYQVALAHELDAAAIALAQHAPLLVSRLRFLNDDAFTGLPRFLAPDQGGASGTMMVEYLAASALGEVHASAAPVSTHTAVLSCGVEEDASFAGTAARQLDRAVAAFELMLACELLVGVRAARLRAPEAASLPAPLRAALGAAAALPAETPDRDLREDVETAVRILPAVAAAALGGTADRAVRAPAPG